jgi:glucose/arabinose dehydrogenase
MEILYQFFHHRFHRLSKILLAGLAFFILATAPSFGQLPKGFFVRKLTGNIIKEATDMTHAPDGRIFIIERSGVIKAFFNGKVSTVYTAQTTVDNEQGLLGITLHPDFAKNGKCYIYYTNPEKTRHYLDLLVITEDNKVTSVKRLVQFDPILAGNHNGGAMVFRRGLLYIAIGESQREAEAAKLDTYRGKVLRLTEDGLPAEGNPYYNTPGASVQQKSIWAIGFRNPWKMSLDPLTQRIFVMDVGGTFEEINDVTNPDPAKKYNFGWDEKSQTGTEQAFTTISPYFFYGRKGWGCAITSGTFFNPRTTNYPAEYRNRFYFSDWCSKWIRSVDAGKQNRDFKELDSLNFERILGTSVGIDGNIYYVKHEGDGSLWRLEYDTGEQPDVINQPESRSVFLNDPVSFSVTVNGGIPLNYQWFKDGTKIEGAVKSTLEIQQVKVSDGGKYTCEIKNSIGSATTQAAILTVKPFNERPKPKIVAPLTSLKWSVGDQVSFSATATDKEDGVLPSSAFSWELRFFHKDDANSEHYHYGGVIPNGVSSGTFIAGNSGEPSPNVWLRLLLTVKDSDGRMAMDSVDIQPNKATLTIASNIPGLSMIMSSQNLAPFAKTFVVNHPLNIQAISPQVLNGKIYDFVSWKHGGDANQHIRVPAKDTTFTATYVIGEALQTPFSGVPITLPGTFEAEDFDKGGEGFAYHDTGIGNQPKGYRPEEDVDIEKCSEGGFNIGFVDNKEWLEYTVNITRAGKYTFTGRVATNAAGKTFHIEIDGENVSGPIAVPATGGFQSWKNVIVVTKDLSAGVKILRVVMDLGGINLNNFTFSQDEVLPADPVVAITSPVDRSTVKVGTPVVVTADATDADGQVVLVEFFQGDTKLGEVTDMPFQFSWNADLAGSYVFTAKATDNLGNTTLSSPVSLSVIASGPQKRSPFHGSPVVLPGRIEAEEFDKGGEGIAYHDLSSGNQPRDFRPDEDVDIEGCSEGGFNIGFVSEGEWLEYTVELGKSSKYTFQARVATNGTGKTFHIEVDGVNISGPVAVPSTGGFQSWQTVSFVTPLMDKGLKVIRFVMDNNDINLNYFSLTPADLIPVNPTVSIRSPADKAVFEHKAEILINVQAADADGVIRKVEFYRDTVKLGESLIAPYAYAWKDAAPGSYKLTAKATDDSGLSTVSAEIPIVVNPAQPKVKAPFSGVAAAVPGKIEAEDFDKGGEGTGYHDLSPGNSGNDYRPNEDVDIEGCSEGGFNIGYVASTEWLEYMINVTRSARYALVVRVAANGEGKTFHLELDGKDISGPVAVPNTGGFQAWKSVSVQTPKLTAGPQVLRIVMDANDINVNYFEFKELPAIAPVVSITKPTENSVYVENSDIDFSVEAKDEDGEITKVEYFKGTQKIGESVVKPFDITWIGVAAGTYSITAVATDDQGLKTVSQPVIILVEPVIPANGKPFSGQPMPIPGRIEAEHFNTGGEGFAYHDSSVGNQSKDLRPSEDVDIEGCTEGGFNIGYITTGEWLSYTVDVKSPGQYRLLARVATTGSDKGFHVEMDGKDVTGTITVPNTNGFQSWQTVIINTAALRGGVQNMRIVVDNGNFNLNYLGFISSDATPPKISVSSPAPNTVFKFNQPLVIQAAAHDDDGSIVKVEFFDGAKKIGESGQKPYRYTWNHVPEGIHVLTAKATDNDGLVQNSAPVQITVNPKPFVIKDIPGLFQAEDYDAMKGIQAENTGDAGGGENIGYVDTGDYMDYKVNVVKSGTYVVGFRIASNSGGGQIELLSGTQVLASVNVNPTGGFQAWTTVISDVKLSAGEQTLRVFAKGGNWNLNWIEFRPQQADNSFMSFSIDDLGEKTIEGYRLYPNPVGDELNISSLKGNISCTAVNKQSAKKYTIKVVDGHAVVNKLPAGNYSLQFTYQKRAFNINFIKL